MAELSKGIPQEDFAPQTQPFAEPDHFKRSFTRHIPVVQLGSFDQLIAVPHQVPVLVERTAFVFNQYQPGLLPL